MSIYIHIDARIYMWHAYFRFYNILLSNVGHGATILVNSLIPIFGIAFIH